MSLPDLGSRQRDAQQCVTATWMQLMCFTPSWVQSAERGLCLWVARRSVNKPNWPGKLDHIVAGGQPYGISVMENVIKECEEEVRWVHARGGVSDRSYIDVMENGFGGCEECEEVIRCHGANRWWRQVRTAVHVNQ